MPVLILGKCIRQLVLSYGDESLMGAAVGIDGNIKSLEYNFSVSTPLKYPATLDIDRVNVNFNFSYQM